MVLRDNWVQKVVCCVTMVCFLTVSVGSVFAQDSTKVSKAPQTTAAPQTSAAPQTTAAPQASTPPQTTPAPQAIVPTQAIAVPQTTAQISAGTAAQIEDAARIDAASDIKGGTWFIVGCLLGLVGWLVAYLIEPNPPATRLLGKSADYVAVYSDAYKKEGKSLQAKKAFSGCLVGELVGIAIYAIIFAASSSK